MMLTLTEEQLDEIQARIKTKGAASRVVANMESERDINLRERLSIAGKKGAAARRRPGSLHGGHDGLPGGRVAYWVTGR